MYIDRTDILRQCIHLKKDIGLFPFNYSIDLQFDDSSLFMTYAIFLRGHSYFVPHHINLVDDITVFGIMKVLFGNTPKLSVDLQVTNLQTVNKDFPFFSSKKLEFGKNIIVSDILTSTFEMVMEWLDAITHMTTIILLYNKGVPLELILPIMKCSK